MNHPAQAWPLDALIRIQQRYLQRESTSVLFSELLEILLKCTGSEMGFIGELRGDGADRALRVLALSSLPDSHTIPQPSGGLEFRRSDTLFGQVLQSGALVIENDASALEARPALPEGHAVLDSFAGIPLYCGDRFIGMAALANRPGGFTERALDAAEPVLVTTGHLLFSMVEERKQQEAMAALQASEDRLEFAVSASTDGLWDWNLRSDEVYYSARWQGMLGFEVGEVPGTPMGFFALIHPEDLARVTEAAQDHREGRTGWYVVEFRMRHKQGGWRWILARGRIRMHPEDGQPWRFMGTHVDITEARQQAEDLRRAKEEAESAQRARAAFVANITHELRTPLNAIISATHLAKQSELDAEQHELLSIVESAGAGLLTLINDVLDLSKFESEGFQIHPRPFLLRGLIERSIRLISPLAEDKGLSFHWEVSERLPDQVHGADNRIHQILNNLLSNAVKYTDAGEIWLRVAPGASPGSVRFVVQDTGIGLSPAAQERVFLPFRQVEENSTRSFGGTGLGLAIVKELASQMGGSLALESRLGVGSTFSVALPLPASQAALTTRVGAPHGPLGGRVLLVEDNPVNRLLMLKILERSTNCSVDVAKDGQEAILMAKRRDYAVILMDCHMPGTDGFEATEGIRALRAPRGGVPIIAQTASAFAEDRARCLEVGMNDFLAKPIQPEALLTVLGRWLPSDGGPAGPGPAPGEPST